MAADRSLNATQPSPLPDTSLDAPPAASRPSRRAWLGLGLVAALLALVILPPYLSVSRFQRRIVASMSQVLGRPVHLDHVSLHLLPFPSFTINNLVIDELPPFGAEPIIRANTVSARLRLSSLWRRRVEFSRITFTDPSINLVRNPDGRWNLESFLLQAAHIDAAPTTQPRPGSAPRFPYIEATGARLNLKLAQQKTPFSLTEVELALWLPEPKQWRLRLHGRPVRTDTGATDTGLLQTEATLERAGSVGQVPLTLDASWIGAPLGEASRVLTGADAGLRGDLSLTAHLAGTLDAATLHLELKLNGLHRADLIPDRLIDVDLHCRAGATRLLHTLTDVHCRWPLTGNTPTYLLHPNPDTAQLTLSGNVPDLLAPASAQLGLTAEHIPAATLLTWARATTGRIAPELQATGELNGTATWPGAAEPATAELDLNHLSLSGGRIGAAPITFAPATLTGIAPSPGTLAGAALSLTPTAISFGRIANQHPSTSFTTGNIASGADPLEATIAGTTPDPSENVGPVAIAGSPASPATAGSPGAREPADHVSPGTMVTPGTGNPGTTSVASAAPTGGVATLSGTATTQGYSAHLTGLVPLARLLALGADVPSFGAGLLDILPTNRAAGPTRVDLSVHRPWGAAPLWTNNLATTASPTLPHTPTLTTRHKAHHPH